MATANFHISTYVGTLIDGAFRHVNTPTFWNRTLLVVFYGCLLLLSHALTGFRLGDAAAPVNQMSTIQRICLGHGEAAHPRTALPIGVVERDESNQKTPMVHFQGRGSRADYLQVPSTIELFPRFASRTETFHSVTIRGTRCQPVSRSTEAFSRPPSPQVPVPDLYYLPHYDPFNLNSFFDTAGYEDDDQPFALKIHLGGKIKRSGTERCQASSGLRCHDEYGQLPSEVGEHIQALHLDIPFLSRSGL